MSKKLIFLLLILFLNSASVLTHTKTSIYIHSSKKNYAFKIFCNEILILESKAPSIVILPSNEECKVKTNKLKNNREKI